MATAEPLGRLIRRYRRAAELSQEALADRAGLSVRAVRDIEAGSKHRPRQDTVQLLLEALAVPAREQAAFLMAAGRVAGQEERIATPPATGVQTFLVADIRGYTRFTLDHGDEAAARLAAQFAGRTREIVSAHEGAVVELRGDEALAVFSSPRQALRAALSLQESLAGETMVDTALPLWVGIGLDAGEAIPLESGYRGTALNLAARLCALAGPGEVLASEGVVHMARKVQGLGYVERGAVQLKGFADLVRVVQVVSQETQQSMRPEGAAAVPPRPLPIAGFLGALPATPIVARDEELRAVLTAVDAVAGGSGRLVFLVGEPGVGKTRLAQEVTLDLRDRGFLVASGRCYEPQEAVPFYPFLEALEALYTTAPPATRSAIPQRWPYLGRLLPNENLPVPASSLEGREERERLFWSVTGFVQSLAEEHPVALLLDDLHWADASSLALLQHLARHTRACAVLLLGTYRDVEVGRQHPLEGALRDLGREQLAERVAIRRLGQEGTQALIATSFGQEEVSTEFAELIHRHTEGNPFFTHEVLQTLVERGDIYQADGQWERREIAELAVPESVRSAIGERLSRLREETQELLHQASVLGQTFAFEDLQAMGGHREEEIERVLEEAAVAGLVRATEKDDYTFNHALTQQALYAELAPRRKRRLHLAAGTALEQLPERKREQRVAELALHFLHGDDPERALPYLLQAGDQAEAVFAHAEAERQYRTALELARELEDQTRDPEAREKLGRVLVLTARFDEGLEMLERAVALYHADGDWEGEARATIEIAHVLYYKGRGGEAVTRLEMMLEPFEGADPSPTQARLYTFLASYLQVTGRYEDRCTAADRAVELAQAVGDERVLADAKHSQGLALINLGRIVDARGAFEEAVELMERLGEVRELVTCVGNLAALYWHIGEFERAQRLCERAPQLAEQLGEPWRIASAFSNLSEISFYLGDWPAARSHAERAAAVLAGSEPTLHTALPALGLGILDLAEGRWADGERHMAECLAVAEQHGDLQALRIAHQWLAERDLLQGRGEDALARLEPLLDRPGYEELHVIFFLPSLALAYLQLGDVDRAEGTVTSGLERASRQSNQVALVDLLRVQGVLRSRQSRWAEAEHAFGEAVSLARSMPYPYAEARALYEWAQMHGAKGEPRPMRERLEEALPIFRRLGARPHVERTEQALAAPW